MNVQQVWTRWFGNRLGTGRRRTARRTPTRNPVELESIESRIVPSLSPLGDQFPVHETLGVEESPPDVAILYNSGESAGEFLSVWQSYEEDGSGFGIYARRFGADGDPIGDAFLVNVTTLGNQQAPTVASDGAGGFVIAWQNEDIANPENGYDIYYREGSYVDSFSLGDELQANTLFVLGEQRVPTAAMDDEGNYLIAWQSQDVATPDNGYDIYARYGDLSTAESGDESLINVDYQLGDQIMPAAAMNMASGSTGSIGDYIVVWKGPDPNAPPSEEEGEVPVALFANINAGTEFPVNAGSYHDLTAPDVAMNNNGVFIVAWQTEGGQGTGSDIYARRFEGADSPLDTNDFMVNVETTAPQRAAAVGIDDAGNFLVTWQSQHEDGFSWGVMGRYYPDPGVGPLTPEDPFLVNNLTQQGPQVAPAVAMMGNGFTVVNWLGPYVPVPGEEGEGGHAPAIHGRVFDNAGALPHPYDELVLNLYLGLEENAPTAAMDKDGNFVVVWQSWEDFGDPSSHGVYARCYDRNGTPLGAAFLVNTTTAGNQIAPSVAMDTFGNFVVTWQSENLEGGYDILGTRFNAAGVALDVPGLPGVKEFVVNSYTTGDQVAPSAGMDKDGDFIVAWDSDDVGHDGIYARRYAASGVPMTAEFQIDSLGSERDPYSPEVAMNLAGQFVVVWVNNVPEGIVDPAGLDTEKSIFARWYNAAGVPAGSEFLVHEYVKDAQEHPAVAIDTHGNYVVAWQSINQEMFAEGDGTSWGVYARQYRPDGSSPQSQEFRVNDTVDDPQRFPTVGTDANGNFVITWQSIGQDESSWGVFSKQYSRFGVVEVGETAVNTYGMGPQTLPVVARNLTDRFGIFWIGQGPAHFEGVHGRLYGPDSVEPPLPPLPEELAVNKGFIVVGATGSPTQVLSIKIFDPSGNLVDLVQPFSFLTSLRVATGDFDGDGIMDEFAVMGRRTGIDWRAVIVTYDLSVDGQATETGRFFAFEPGILGNGFIAAGDFDGDGDDDLAVAQIGGDRTVVTLQIHESTPAGFVMGGSALLDFGIIAAPRIGAGDTDGDGLDEIVTAVRTPEGARIMVFDVDEMTPMQQNVGFFWDFGIEGYARGAFVAVGEFDPTSVGEEIVLGSNIGGGGRVDIVHYDPETATATLVENGRLTPFGAGYNAAVRVAVGHIADRISLPVIVAGQDRFQAGQGVILARDYDIGSAPQVANPPFETTPVMTMLTPEDGLGPPESLTGNLMLGPFVAFANTGLVHAQDRTDAAIAGGTVATFQIAGNTLALPGGAAFNDPANKLFVDVNLLGADLSDVDLYLRVLDAGGNLLQQEQLVNANLNPTATEFNVQFSDGLASSAQPDAFGRLLGYFAPLNVLDDLFTDGAVTGLDNTWELAVANNTTSPVTLVDWELTFAFAA